MQKGRITSKQGITKLETKKISAKKVPNPNFRIGQKVIGECLKEDSKIVWPRELKVFYSLYEKYPNKDFWDSFNLGFRLNSMAFFKTGDGASILDKNWKIFNFEPPKKKFIEIGKEKIGEDKVIYNKPRSFIEFYNKSLAQ